MTRGTPTQALLMGVKPFDRAEADDVGLLRDDVTELVTAGRLRSRSAASTSTPGFPTTSPPELPA